MKEPLYISSIKMGAVFFGLMALPSLLVSLLNPSEKRER